MASVYVNGSRAAYAREAVSALTTAKSLTASVYNIASGVGTTYNQYDRVIHPTDVTIQVKGAAINWTIDGTNPTTTATTDIGFVSQVGETINLPGFQNIMNFKCINSVASSGATIEVVYYA